MKKIYIAIAAFIAVACSPIVDNKELMNSFDKDNVQLSATQEVEGSNQITLKLESKGIAGYWDYIIGQKYTDEVSVIFPFTGEHTFTYHITTPYITDGDAGNIEYISKSITVEVTQLDTKLDDAYYNLVGDDLGGKAWVFDGVAGDGGIWWAMVNGANYQELWWNAGGNGDELPADFEGKMYFDVAGGANYDYYASAEGEPVRGTFSFNSTYTTLTFGGGVDILGSNGGSTTYQIIELTEDKLTLFSSSTDRETGWIWSFKKAE